MAIARAKSNGPATGAGSPAPTTATQLLEKIQRSDLTPRDAWVMWLSPRFSGNESAYVTGTYSDEYGFPHGLMKTRNVHKDVRLWLKSLGLETLEFICGAEEHAYRDILHWHGIVKGPFSDLERAILKASWSAERGHCRVLPVLDGCASYVTKYALKADSDAFDWNLS